MCNNKPTDNSCIMEILNVINILQQNACPENCLDTCDRPMLGGGTNCLICNTRPVMLYTCCGNGVPFSQPTSKDLTGICSNPVAEVSTSECSNVFRVEKVEGNCCTFRVLAPNPDVTSRSPYIGTNSFFTFNLDCCCCIRCLSDCYIECV